MLQFGVAEKQFIVDCRKHDPTRLLKALAKKKLVGHNLKFDYQVIKSNYGIVLEDVFDTMLGAQIVECGLDKEEKKGWFSLESVSRRYLNKDYYSNQLSLF